MGKIATSVVEDAHSYTRSSAPWLIDAYQDAKGETTTGDKFGWRLFHYLSGGGMKTFGRTIRQEEADLKRTRFLLAAAVVGVVWLCFWI